MGGGEGGREVRARSELGEAEREEGVGEEKWKQGESRILKFQNHFNMHSHCHCSNTQMVTSTFL